jgi:hypothetical protein
MIARVEDRVKRFLTGGMFGNPKRERFAYERPTTLNPLAGG